LKKIKASEVGGSGALQATASDGTLLISGNNRITITTEGVLTAQVYDRAGGVTAETIGETTTEIVDRKTTYSGFTEATFDGDDFVILLTGSIKILTATGEGRAYLEGTGTYQTGSGGVAKDVPSGGVVYNIAS